MNLLSHTQKWIASTGILMLFWTGHLSQAAQSTYSGGNNRANLSKGVEGPLNLGPRAEYGSMQLRGNQEFTFDDNVFLTEFARLHDWASITSPGLSYKLGSMENNYLELGYDVNIRRYMEQTVSDGEEHLPYMMAQFTFGATKLTISDNMNFTKGGGVIIGGNELTVRVPKTTNDANVATETKLDDKLALGFHVHHNLYDPGTAPLLFQQQIDGGFDIYYKAFAKADLYIEGDGGHVDVTRGGRQDYAQARVGIRGDLTPKLVGRLDVGGEHRMFSFPGIRDQDTPVLSSSLTYTFNDDFKARVNGGLSTETSISTAGQTYELSTAGFNLNYQFGPFLTNDTKVRKLALTLDYGYAGSQFNLASGGVVNTTDLHTVTPSFEFRIRPYWLAYLMWRYQNNDSILQNGDYFDNRFSVGTSVLF